MVPVDSCACNDVVDTTRAAAAKAQLDAFEQALASGTTPPAVSQEVDRNPDVNYARSVLNNIEMEMAANVNLGPDHRRIESLQQQRDFAEQKMQDARASAEAKASPRLTGCTRWTGAVRHRTGMDAPWSPTE